MNLRQAIKELGLLEDDKIYTHQYQKDDYAKDPTLIADLSAALLKKQVLLVQPNYGGKENGYQHLMFILK